MLKFQTKLTALALASLFAVGTAQAAVSAQEAAKLGTTLTEFGAEKAGNAAGTIPPWTGGLTRSQWPAGFKPGGRLVAVEGDVRVGEVVDDQDVMLLCQSDDFFEERQIHALRRRIAREVDDQELGLGIGVADRAFEFLEKIDVRVHGHVVNVGARDHRTVDVYRIARIGHEHDIAAIERGEGQVRDAFFRSDQWQNFCVGIERYAIPGLIPVDNGRSIAFPAG